MAVASVQPMFMCSDGNTAPWLLRFTSVALRKQIANTGLDVGRNV